MATESEKKVRQISEEKSWATVRGFQGSGYVGEHVGDYEFGKFLGRHKHQDNGPTSGLVVVPIAIALAFLTLTWFPTQFAYHLVKLTGFSLLNIPLSIAFLIVMFHFAFLTVGFSRVGVFISWFLLTLILGVSSFLLLLFGDLGFEAQGRAVREALLMHFVMGLFSYALFLGISFVLRYYAFRRFGSYRVKGFWRLVFRKAQKSPADA